jgi:PTH1 family peptidyl-tRNA hydrolase
VKFLIAGLGNIGEEYAETRHNVGFKIAEALAEEAGASFNLDRHAYHASFRLKGKILHIIKPTTYMNLSGKAVKYWMEKLDLENKQLLIVVDDLALPFGELRIRSKGSDGNHNGLTSMHETFNTDEYTRMRFGIGGNFQKGQQVNYVLGRWSEEEQKLLPQKISIACEAARSFVLIGFERTMNLYNKTAKKSVTDEGKKTVL